MLTMLVGGSRISLHLRECDLSLGLGLGFYSARFVPFSSLKPHHNLNHGSSPSRTWISSSSSSSSSSTRSQSHGNLPILSDCFSQQEDTCECEPEPPPVELSSVAGGIVALGKFDALHIGHRELAIQASKVGAPYLLSFVGMAEVLGWEPRIPIVAKCDRKRVLSSWGPYCGDVVPVEFKIEFSSVRHLSPRQFVEKLSKELGVCGVVAGKNYRFGYKAAGDAAELAKLCGEYGIRSYIINSVMDKNQQFIDFDGRNSKERGQVSSTRVRHALAVGDMRYVSDLLGRHHRLIVRVTDQEGFKGSKHLLSAPKSYLLNLAPRDGIYHNCYLILGQESSVPCRVVLDATLIHVEMDEGDLCNYIGFQDLKVLQIEFGDSRL